MQDEVAFQGSGYCDAMEMISHQQASTSGIPVDCNMGLLWHTACRQIAVLEKEIHALEQAISAVGGQLEQVSPCVLPQPTVVKELLL